MKLKDRFAFVRQNIKKNKVRTFMTILATSMGCAFLIVLASVGYGLQQSIIDDTMEQQIVTKIDVHGHEDEDGNYEPLVMEDVEFLESVDGVQAVTRRKRLQQIPTFEIGNYQTEAETVVADFPSEIKSGLTLHEGKLPEADDEIIVGFNFAEYIHSITEDVDLYDEEGNLKEEYQYNEKLIGKTIDMTVSKEEEAGEDKTLTIPLKIVGITEKPTKEWKQDTNAYIPQEVLSEIEAFTGTAKGTPFKDEDGTGESYANSHAYDEVKVYAENLEGVEAVSNQLADANYATYSVVSELKQINMLFTIAKAGLILIGTIAILIASIGIYNTMTMAVTERAPDIGIMKAIGANPKTIKQIFLLESSYIGIIGAAIGTIVAYGISVLVNVGLPLIIETAFGEELPEGLRFSTIPLTLVLISVGICLLVTILSGVRPAKRATKIDVLKAMRREV